MPEVRREGADGGLEGDAPPVLPGVLPEAETEGEDDMSRKKPAIRGEQESPPKRGGPAHTLFQKGTSGNPSGRPKDYPGFREAMRDMGEKAVAVLQEILDHGEEAQRLHAAKFVVEMGWGKAAQAVQLTGSEGGPVQVESSTNLKGFTDADLDALEGIAVRVAIARGDSGGEGAPPAA